ncbi:MAG: hypothetical protein K6G65_08375 [Lachnospiraceae bacterium]|nr:hypothetical protein [Lachnospiraceae bacterium]
MLGKLIKHEFKATYQLFLAIYLIAFASIPFAIFSLSQYEGGAFIGFFKGFSLFAFIILLIGVNIASTIICIYRFYTHVLGAESYLTNTLPVKPFHLITSKALVSGFWSLCGNIVSIICGYVVLKFSMPHIINEAKTALHELYKMLSYDTYFHLENGTKLITRGSILTTLMVLLTACILSIILSLVSTPVLYYCSMVVGQYISPKHKVVSAIITYFVINFAMNIISSVASSILIISSSFRTDPYIYADEVLTLVAMLRTITYRYMPFALVFSIAVFIGTFFVTNHLLDKRLNLE